MQDGSEVPQLIENFEKAERELDRLSKEISDAKKLQKFCAGTEKALLAKYAVAYIREGNKPALAETLALADPAYLKERETMMDAWVIAQKVLDAHAQAYTSWDTARSLLSMAKSQFPAAYSAARNFPG